MFNAKLEEKDQGKHILILVKSQIQCEMRNATSILALEVRKNVLMQILTQAEQVSNIFNQNFNISTET